jgi:hypothetical protein
MIYCITSTLYKQCMRGGIRKGQKMSVEIVRVAAALMANWDCDDNPRPVVHFLQSIQTANDGVEWHWSSNKPVNRHEISPDTFDKSQGNRDLGRRRYFQWSLSGACNELSVCLLTAIHRLEQSGCSLTICGQPFGSARFVKADMTGFPNPSVWDRFQDDWTSLVPTRRNDRMSTEHTYLLVCDAKEGCEWVLDLAVPQFGCPYERASDFKEQIGGLVIPEYLPLAIHKLKRGPGLRCHPSITQYVRSITSFSPLPEFMLEGFLKDMRERNAGNETMLDYIDDTELFLNHLLQKALSV